MDERTREDIKQRIVQTINESQERYVPIDRGLLKEVAEELIPYTAKLEKDRETKAARIRAMAEKTTHLLAEFVRVQDEVDGYKRALTEFEQRIRDKSVLNEEDIDAILLRIRRAAESEE